MQPISLLKLLLLKGRIMSELRMYLENHQFSKIPPKKLIDICPGKLYRLGSCDLFFISLKATLLR